MLDRVLLGALYTNHNNQAQHHTWPNRVFGIWLDDKLIARINEGHWNIRSVAVTPQKWDDIFSYFDYSVTYEMQALRERVLRSIYESIMMYVKNGGYGDMTCPEYLSKTLGLKVW